MRETPVIYIVDDHEEVRDALSDSLSSEHYQLLTFSSGKELLAFDGDPKPDVILLDVMMPGMDGFTVCARLKAREDWQHIPIILVTALNTREYMVRGLEAGAEEYLVKPVNNVELRARVRSMLRIKRQYDQLQEMLKMREKLSNMIVHDMRQPLTTAMLRLFLINHRGQLEPDDKADLKIVQMHLRRIESLTNDILLAAKMQEGRFLLERTSVDLKDMIEEMMVDYVLLAQAINVTMIVELPDTDKLCDVDANIIIRLIDNLISNAIKFSPKDSQITLRLTYPSIGQKQACLQVIDEGPGIPADFQDEIFDEYRIIAMREKNGPQIGLGLAFCKMAVEAHNGRIYVSPNSPTGSIFTVEL
jgi:signal transduction histidine kinase